ncbi:hypothetical protein SELSPUOL_00185 [Selenomonas sputigena ATCC 35185]|uniref:Uncharacterized protein n=1 Tax=Selenomonas sputigena (strain ATCC 35185 / DSM 20758 / CCUG 44933 / VPI D19B-28) TaxID=546271 RepID=C9LRW4_SELS3|nr:hypothetical protein SELSPUOL_00185 [Selenomonas sputigena ATCC 35185]
MPASCRPPREMMFAFIILIINYTVLFWNTFRKNSNHTICFRR